MKLNLEQSKFLIIGYALALADNIISEAYPNDMISESEYNSLRECLTKDIILSFKKGEIFNGRKHYSK